MFNKSIDLLIQDRVEEKRIKSVSWIDGWGGAVGGGSKTFYLDRNTDYFYYMWAVDSPNVKLSTYIGFVIHGTSIPIETYTYNGGIGYISFNSSNCTLYLYEGHYTWQRNALYRLNY